MEEKSFLIQALIYLLAAVISVPIAKKLGLGSVLGYLLAGIIIGPFALGLIGEEGSDVMHFAEFGVVMMLFLIGLELKPNLLWSMKRSIFGLGGLQVLLSTAIIGTIALIFNQSIKSSLAIGLILALSSTAIVLQTLAEKGIIKQAAGQASFSVLLFQDMAVIPILAILPLLASSEISALRSASHAQDTKHVDTANYIAGIEIQGWFQVLLILVVMAGIIFVGRFLARHIFRIIAKTGLREIFTAAALLIVIAIAIVMEMVGLSPALGAFVAGVVLANSEYRHELEADIEPFKGLLLGLFFISVGASIDFSLLAKSPLMIVGLLVVLVSLKSIILFILGRFFGLKGGQNILFTFSLAQGGEFAFVLIAFSSQNSVLTEEISSILLIVVALSMAFTPLLLLINEKLIQPRIVKGENQREADEIVDSSTPVIIAGFGRFGVVVGRLLIANGFKATILDNDPDHIEVLKKFGFNVYYGDATRPDLLRAAGCENARVLVVAINDKKKSMEIIDYVKRTYPHLNIVGRAQDMQHAYEYLKRDIVDFDHDTLESSIQLGIKALTKLGFTRNQAFRAARIFRKYDEEVMHKLFEHYGEDEKKYLSEAKRLADELEELFKTEQEDPIHETDSAWDATTLREEVREIYAEMDGKK